MNRAIDARRKIARYREDVVEDTDQQLNQLEKTESTEDTVLIKAKQEMIHREIDSLPEQYREVIQSFYLQEKSYEQISQETGIEKKSVESRLYRARLWMKRHWRKEDFE